MDNPPVLPCDTDALLQLFLVAPHTKSLIPLRILRDDFGIQPAIVPEVETELMWNRRYGARFVPELRKALGNRTIEILDLAAFSKYVPGHLAKGVFGNYQSAGQQYSKIVDRGEAYTLAAAAILDVPALSNDMTALEALDYNNLAVPSPVLRAFDLFALSYQTGALIEKECDTARKKWFDKGSTCPERFRTHPSVMGSTSFVRES